MANPYERRIGRTRIKLAKMLSELFPELDIRPEDLKPQIPIYATMQFDSCSWHSHCRPKKFPKLIHNIHSWDTMGHCVARGIAIVTAEHTMTEVCAKDGINNPRRKYKSRNNHWRKA